MRSMEFLAAIDIGSNALRLAIARQTSQHFHICHTDREPVRLGSDVFTNGAISMGTYESLRDAVLKFRNQMENFNVKRYRAVATSALREAKNRQEILLQLKQDTKIDLELIDGEEEAKIVFDAIATKVDIKTDSHLLIDIGGGSIELIAVFSGKILKKKSFPLGSVRLLAMAKAEHQVPDRQMRDWLVPHIAKTLARFFLDLGPFDYCVGTGGNMDRFAKMKTISTGRPADLVLANEIKAMREELEVLSYRDRIDKFQLGADRVDVILPAIIATETIMTAARAQAIKLPQVGLREGILYEMSSSIIGR